MEFSNLREKMGPILDKNYLNLFDMQKMHEKYFVKARDVATFLDLDTKEISKAVGIPQASVRFDNKIPQKLVETFQDMAWVCEMVANIFEGDLLKTNAWFKLPNPNFGGLSPRDIIRIGRFSRVKKFILSALEGNI